MGFLNFYIERKRHYSRRTEKNYFPVEREKYSDLRVSCFPSGGFMFSLYPIEQGYIEDMAYRTLFLRIQPTRHIGTMRPQEKLLQPHASSVHGPPCTSEVSTL